MTMRQHFRETGAESAQTEVVGESSLGRQRYPRRIRIDFPGFSGQDSLEKISWDDWFQAFEENDLAFLHRDMEQDGRADRFNKLVRRNQAD